MTNAEIKNIIKDKDLGQLPIELLTDAINNFLDSHFKTNKYEEVNKALKVNPLNSYLTGEDFKDVEDIVVQLSDQTIAVFNEDIPVSESAMKSTQAAVERMKKGDFFGQLLAEMY